MEKINPFFINTNLCYTQQECSNLDSFLDNISGNTGNSYIAYSVIKEIYGKIFPVPEIKNLWSFDFKDEEKLVSQINSSHSHVILLLQDQIRLELSYGIRPDWERINSFLSKLKKPFIVFSLGANDFGEDGLDWWKKLPSGVVEFLHILSRNSVSLGVRGFRTLEILNKLGIQNAKAIGCPTFFEEGPNKKIIKKPLKNLSDILGADAFNAKSPRLFSGVIQDEVFLLKLLYFNDFCPDVMKRVSPACLISLAKGGVRCFAGMENWKKFVSQFTCCISSRMHGGILALNSGVPAIVINKDLRATEMCQLFKIPHYPQLKRIKDWRELYEQADFGPLNKQYPQLYASFKNWLEENGLSSQAIVQARQAVEAIPSIKEPTLSSNPYFNQWAEHIIKNKCYYFPMRDILKLLVQKIFKM